MIPKKVEIPIKIDPYTISTPWMWATVLAPKGIVGLAVVAPVWIDTRAEE
jgi:hypothetical protein